jgi:hypothetical protein
MGGRPLLWWKESQATCPRAAPVPTQHLNTRLHIDANRLSHRAAVFSLSTLQKYRTFFFLLTFTFTKKGFPGKTGLVAIKQDLWWLGVHQPRWYYKLAISPHG